MDEEIFSSENFENDRKLRRKWRYWRKLKGWLFDDESDFYYLYSEDDRLLNKRGKIKIIVIK